METGLSLPEGYSRQSCGLTFTVSEAAERCSRTASAMAAMEGSKKPATSALHTGALRE